MCLLLNKDWIRNWFREPVELGTADYILVKKYNAAQVLTTNPGMAVRFVRRLRQKIAAASDHEERWRQTEPNHQCAEKARKQSTT